METFNAVQAGRWLGFTERTVRNMVTRGELQLLSSDPVRFDPRHVDEVLRERQAGVVRELVESRRSAVQLAAETVQVLRPRNEETPLPDRVATRHRLKLSLVPDRAKWMFGTASLNAALVSDGSCRWCKAADFAKVLGSWAPDRYSEGFAALFDQQPCEVCGPGLYGPVLASLVARVHPGRHRPPDARAEAAAAVPPAPRPRPAQPLQADDGKAMVSRRLREVRGRLKDARRRGDTRHALALQQQLQSLTADASVVDGRPVSSRPGTLRCGHALAAGCSCPRRASKRATS